MNLEIVHSFQRDWKLIIIGNAITCKAFRRHTLEVPLITFDNEEKALAFLADLIENELTTATKQCFMLSGDQKRSQGRTFGSDRGLIHIKLDEHRPGLRRIGKGSCRDGIAGEKRPHRIRSGHLSFGLLFTPIVPPLPGLTCLTLRGNMILLRNEGG